MLVEHRRTRNYREAASILADLRDAIGGGEGSRIAGRHATSLAKMFPALNVLKSSLRKRGLLDSWACIVWLQLRNPVGYFVRVCLNSFQENRAEYVQGKTTIAKC
ncbi:MAG: hypothetical protein RIS70_3230, partial [Planctomycetota bacterium]